MKKQENKNEQTPSTKGIFGWIKDILRPYSREIEELRTPPPEAEAPEAQGLSIKEEAPEAQGLSSKSQGLSSKSQEGLTTGNRAFGNSDNRQPTTDNSSDNGQRETDNLSDNGQRETGNSATGASDNGCCCPFRIKRNIVKSLRAIREFAEEHDLAASVVRALLSLLAEIALGALKGKVSETVLEALLKVFNHERELEESRLRNQLDREEFLREKEREIEEAYRRGEIAGRNARIEEEFFPAQPEEVPNLKGIHSASGGNEPDIFSMAKEA